VSSYADKRAQFYTSVYTSAANGLSDALPWLAGKIGPHWTFSGRPLPWGALHRLTLHPTWLNLVDTFGWIDRGEGIAEIVG
jgi:hypothetical protein